ncbi:hypothetical protein D3C76_1589380 [compost metagenome]
MQAQPYLYPAVLLMRVDFRRQIALQGEQVEQAAEDVGFRFRLDIEQRAMAGIFRAGAPAIGTALQIGWQAVGGTGGEVQGLVHGHSGEWVRMGPF